MKIVCIIFSLIVLLEGMLALAVIRRAVFKIRAEEIRKHQDLINHMNDSIGEWQDIVIAVEDAIYTGKLAGKGINDQIHIVEDIVKTAGKEEPPEELTPDE